MDDLGWKSLDIIACTLLNIGAISWGWVFRRGSCGPDVRKHDKNLQTRPLADMPCSIL